MATPKPPSTDEELAAVKAVMTALEKLEPMYRHRVLRAAEALQSGPGPFMPPMPPGPRPGGETKSA